MTEELKPGPAYREWLVKQLEAWTELDAPGKTANTIFLIGAAAKALRQPVADEAMVERVASSGQFLLDRLDELDWSQSFDDFSRDYSGHVDPAISHFRAAINAIKGTDNGR
jgi:hypothetical protein